MTRTQVVFPKHIGMKHLITTTLYERLFLDQWIVPKGTLVKTFQTKNFGWLVLPPGCQDERGFEIPRRIHKW